MKCNDCPFHTYRSSRGEPPIVWPCRSDCPATEDEIRVMAAIMNGDGEWDCPKCKEKEE